MEELKRKAIRVVSTFQPGTPDVDPAHVVPPYEKKVVVRIIGNSFYPKVLQITEGTTIEWINEDVFTYADGEFAGIHNAVAISGPERFASPLLGHGEKFSFTFKKAGEYEYMCTPHPYMRGKIMVVKKAESPLAFLGLLSIVSLLVLVVAVVMLIRRK